MKKVENYTNKVIGDFNRSDTLYMQRAIGGYRHTFLIRFETFSRGMVVGELLDIQPNNMKSIWIGKKLYRIGDQISGKISTCYTAEDQRAKWFEKTPDGWRCN